MGKIPGLRIVLRVTEMKRAVWHGLGTLEMEGVAVCLSSGL